MTAAVIQICSDPRLNHETIRHQVRSRLERLGVSADRIFILNEVGGNISANLRNTLDLLVKRREPVVFAAVLHHDDCLAAQEGVREPLDRSAVQLATLLRERRISCPVLSGSIVTDNSAVLWSDDPARRYETLPFRMPRMYS